MHTYIALGANEGDEILQFERAVTTLDRIARTLTLALRSLPFSLFSIQFVLIRFFIYPPSDVL